MKPHDAAARTIMIPILELATADRLFGVEWNVWKVIGWAGNLIFFSRFFVQWIATEKRKEIVVPVSFWWLSLTGSLLLLVYGLERRDSVFIFSYAFTWIPYIRNIIIHLRNRAARKQCGSCGRAANHHARYCDQCGTELGHMVEETVPRRCRSWAPMARPAAAAAR